MQQKDIKNLTDEQLAEKAKALDEDAINELLVRYKPIINAISRSYFLVGGDMEDIVQEGMIGLYKAMRSYSSDKKASFKTFASVCIEHQIQNEVKKASNEKNKILSTALPILEQFDFDDDEGGEIILKSDLPQPDDKIIANERIKELNIKIKQKLSLLEQKILSLYLRGYNYNEISTLGGVSKKSIDNALTRIKQKLSFLKDNKEDVG